MDRRHLLLTALSLTACKRGEPLPDLGKVPPFAFTNQEGKAYGSADLTNNIWVADFFFTNCPGPCPRMANQLRRVQESTTDLPNLRLVSISVDPDRDTVEVLAAYAKRQKAIAGRWHFLNGRKDLVKSLMSEAMYLGDAGTVQDHSTRFVLVDGAMRMRGFYDSFAADSIEKLIKDIRNLHDHS
jgi:protein SCO1/2